MDRRDRATTLGPRGMPDYIYQSRLEGEYDQVTTKCCRMFFSRPCQLACQREATERNHRHTLTCGCKIHPDSFFFFFWWGVYRRWKITARIQEEVMAASEDAYYVVPHIHPQRGPRLSAPLWHRDAAIQQSSVQTACYSSQSPIIQIFRHRLI